MKVWSTIRDWVPQWGEVGQKIADAIKKNPTIQSTWDKNINHLNMGPESLQNFREDLWVNEGGSVRPVSSPFMLTNSLDLDEEVKKVRSCDLRSERALMAAQLEAAFINLPSEDEEDSRFPPSPLTNVSDAVTTPPLSPCTPFLSPDSIDSPCYLPTSPFLSTLPFSLSGHRTISPYEIFSPLPQVEDLVSDTLMEEPQAPPTPVVPTKSLPELPNARSDTTPLSSPSPPPSRPQSPPIAGPSRSAPKRSRWTEDESGDESDDFTPQTRKAARPGKRLKVGSLKRVNTKSKAQGTMCDLCGRHLGRATDLPRHKASCKSNPERATRKKTCEICGKLLPGTL